MVAQKAAEEIEDLTERNRRVATALAQLEQDARLLEGQVTDLERTNTVLMETKQKLSTRVTVLERVERSFIEVRTDGVSPRVSLVCCRV